jgi:hypothetical protein
MHEQPPHGTKNDFFLLIKRQFGLDPTDVMFKHSETLEQENKLFMNLIGFIHAYREHGCDREKMIATYGPNTWPPIFPGISPENDWFRFEEWHNNRPVNRSAASVAGPEKPFLPADQIEERHLTEELDRLHHHFHLAGMRIGYCEGLPQRLEYQMLMETYDEERPAMDPFFGGGGWTLDGCTGYCPGCHQRMWCDTGSTGIWTEDTELGKMHLIPELSAYVSALPNSLEVMRSLGGDK